jgi:hypothetical protein
MSPQPDPVVLGVLFESVPGLEPCYLPFETGLERLAQLAAVLDREPASFLATPGSPRCMAELRGRP